MTTLSSPIAHATNQDLVFVSQDNELVTNSILVSKFFGKRHEQVLRKLKDLDCSQNFGQHNFVSAHYKDSQGKIRPKYQMTKNGFMFLVMGFTGKKAAQIKERYIQAFDEMAEKLTSPQAQLPPNTMTLPDFHHQRIMLTVENGVTVQTKLLSNDEFIVDRNRLDVYMRDPEIFSIEQLISSYHSFNTRIENFMQARLRRIG